MLWKNEILVWVYYESKDNWLIVGDSATRQNLRSMFPEAPITKDALEAQQKALIREQQDELRELGGPRMFQLK